MSDDDDDYTQVHRVYDDLYGRGKQYWLIIEGIPESLKPKIDNMEGNYHHHKNLGNIYFFKNEKDFLNIRDEWFTDEWLKLNTSH